MNKNRFLTATRGAALPDYVILLALTAALALLSVAAFGDRTTSAFSTATNSVRPVDAPSVALSGGSGASSGSEVPPVPLATLTISTSQLPPATAWQHYSATLQATPPQGAMVVSWSASGLPGGLSVDNAGTLSGTPTEASWTRPLFTVTDDQGHTASANLRLQIAGLGLSVVFENTLSNPLAVGAVAGGGLPAGWHAVGVDVGPMGWSSTDNEANAGTESNWLARVGFGGLIFRVYGSGTPTGPVLHLDGVGVGVRPVATCHSCLSGGLDTRDAPDASHAAAVPLVAPADPRAVAPLVLIPTPDGGIDFFLTAPASGFPVGLWFADVSVQVPAVIAWVSQTAASPVDPISWLAQGGDLFEPDSGSFGPAFITLYY